MGFEWVDYFDNDNDNEDANDTVLSSRDENGIKDTLQVTNLLDDDDDDNFEYYDQCYRQHKLTNNDAWTDNALRIQAGLKQMSQWIQSKKQEYIGLDMKDEEAGLIQSTVTSFAATTASELETLRNMITSNSRSTHNKTTVAVVVSNNLANHRAGVVQILLMELQEQVTKTFAILQKQRVREAVQLWQNPLQCKLYCEVPKRKVQGQKRPQDVLFDDDEEHIDEQQRPKEQRFLPDRSYQQSSNDNNRSDGDSFISKYANKPRTNIPITPPNFLAMLSKRQYSSVRIENSQSPTLATLSSPSTDERKRIFENPPKDIPSSFGGNVVAAQQLPEGFQSRSQGRHDNPEHYRQQLEEDLRTESAQLTTTLIASNDFDSVQQMEKRMVEITTLIGQFSNLVQEQQEQVLQVHESAKETKDNINKGQDHLIDAAERTKKSKHYKAWSIIAMAAILAFFQMIRN